MYKRAGLCQFIYIDTFGAIERLKNRISIFLYSFPLGSDSSMCLLALAIGDVMEFFVLTSPTNYQKSSRGSFEIVYQM